MRGTPAGSKQNGFFFLYAATARATGDRPLGAPADVAEEFLAIAGERK